MLKELWAEISAIEIGHAAQYIAAFALIILLMILIGI